MPEKHLFEYAVIRIVPRVEREEFINAGVVLYCAKQRFLQMLFEIKAERLLSFYPAVDLNAVTQRLQAFEYICDGSALGGPIGKLPPASRFRWLTAARSTIVQTSPVHPGLCVHAEETLARLYIQLVC